MMTVSLRVVSAVAMLWLFAGGPAFAQERGGLTIGLGAYNFDDSNPMAGEVRLEYQPGLRFFRYISPVFGLMVNTETAVFAYGGLQADIWVSDRWILYPSFGVGAYDRGNSRDLGGVFEFHLGLGLAYSLDNEDRVGLYFAHISNASIHDKNPSVNSILVTYRLALGDPS